MTARKKADPKDEAVSELADALLEMVRKISDTPCPACGACRLDAELVGHSGVRITCGGIDDSENSDDEDGCTFVRVRRLDAPVVRRARKSELVVVEIDKAGAP